MKKYLCPRTGIAIAALSVTMAISGCQDRQEGEGPGPDGNDQPAAMVPRPAASPIVETARRDLAERLNRPVEDVELLENRSVYWKTAALGCPEPDRSYPQVLTRGWLIRLTVGGAEYRYHSGIDGPPFTCSPRRAEPPVPYSVD